MQKKSQRILMGGILLICLGLVLLFIANYTILQRSDRIVPDMDPIPTTTMALVFGGGMIDDTTMSDLQTDRVERAIALYKSGTVQKLVMTGDDGQRYFDEVHAMKYYAIDHGVYPEDISLDPHGYNTYSSCYRAKHVYDVTRMIAISQTFHLSRIIYFCEHFGIETIGVPADLRAYGWRGRWWGMTGREILARLKGWWQVEVTEPGPIVIEAE